MKIGRPRKRNLEPGVTTSLGLKVRIETKSRIAEAADESGWSMSREVEFRLERTFRDDEILSRLDKIEKMLAGIVAEVRR